ncbi:hypothetical protein [Sphingomonas sp. URHD0057]|uniref:hypothetical protein n=1 Tax=Sphingomonas sp. URHD0057 TaxID=1380389 RepID=UPI000AFBDDF7|nr:hypothetical protein [Sphingomonas sp. URHD0057]
MNDDWVALIAFKFPNICFDLFGGFRDHLDDTRIVRHLGNPPQPCRPVPHVVQQRHAPQNRSGNVVFQTLLAGVEITP